MTATPCDWPLSFLGCDMPTDGEGLRAAYPEPLLSMPIADIALIEAMAVELVWNWSGRKFGVCPVTVRPTAPDCIPDWTTYRGRGPFPTFGAAVVFGGRWYARLLEGLGRRSASHFGPNALELLGPVSEITQVLVNGAVVDPSRYSVAYGRYLLRLDGEAWPEQQDLSAPPLADNTFEVSYLQGVPVPAGGQLAAGRLALELAKAFCGDSSCQLPERLQTITRQGVTVGFQDQFEMLDSGKVGIWTIDSWIAAVTQPQPGASVVSPDVPRRGRTFGAY